MLKRYFTSIKNGIPMDVTFKKRKKDLNLIDEESFTENSDNEDITSLNQNNKVKVFDRFTLIL